MLDLVARAKPLDPVKFPNGRILAVRPLDADGWELVRRAQQAPTPDHLVAALRWAVPEATDEDINTLGLEDIGTVLTHAARQIVLMLDTVGNSSGATTVATPAPPSPPAPTPSTS